MDRLTCHVCQEERPDAKLSILILHRALGGPVTITQHVRYCLDRLECAENAPHVDFFTGLEGEL